MCKFNGDTDSLVGTVPADLYYDGFEEKLIFELPTADDELNFGKFKVGDDTLNLYVYGTSTLVDSYTLTPDPEHPTWLVAKVPGSVAANIHDYDVDANGIGAVYYTRAGEGWYIDSEDCLHITGAVHNESTLNENKCPWKDYAKQIKSAVAEDGASIKNGAYLFAYANNMTSVDLAKLDTTGIKDIEDMFNSCWKLESVDLSTFDTSELTDMSSLFAQCNSLKSVTFGSEFNTSKVTFMRSLFEGCWNLENIDISMFDTSSATHMSWMFRQCSKLRSITFGPKFSTANVQYMTEMFAYCTDLTELDLSGFDMSAAKNFGNMLLDCTNLETIGVNPGVLDKVADQILDLADVWKDTSNKTVCTTEDELKAISEKTTIAKCASITVEDDGHGTAEADMEYGVPGEAVTLTATPDTGYAFKEWQSDDVTVEDDAFVMPKHDVTVKAVFEAIVYDITYVLNDEDSVSSAKNTNVETYTVEDEITLADAVRAGYTFLGWFDNAECTGTPVTSFGNGEIGDKTFYAGWEIIVYDITYDTHGAKKNSNPTTYTVEDTIKLNNPVKPLFMFRGWICDALAEDGKTIPAGTIGDLFIDSEWVLLPVGEEPEAFPFDDVPADLADDVAFVYDNDLMIGVSDTKFAPNMSLSRAMIVTILYRLEGEPAFMNDNIFTDVEAGSWYEKAVVWANGKGIVLGYGNGKFGTNDPVTREQMTAILYRYAQYKGYDVSINGDTNFLSYDDIFDIHDYARTPILWALSNDLIDDVNGALYPTADASRAVVAAFFHRFCEAFVK